MSFTVVPLHNLSLAAGTNVRFGNGFTFQDLPQWVKDDKGILKDLKSTDRNGTLEAQHALVAEYEADSFGYPDPEWKGQKPKSIQDLRFQSAMLASLAIWLRQPSTVCFTVGFHALSRLNSGPILDTPIILQAPDHPPLRCHPKDQFNAVYVSHIAKAGELHSVLTTVPRKNAVWAALRAFWAALTSYPPDHRYPLFWQGLESLFGADSDRYGITRRLRERISLFLAGDDRERCELSDKVLACYDMRCEIVHGRWDEGPEIDHFMAETEAIVRTVVRHMLEKPGMLGAFISSKRDNFLDAWVQSQSLTPPQFP